ncbi:alpha-2-macroglobulin-P-like [Megachile rotundata]|uniref:alpha-2-macroglobulin-P-like n=1 Tax=Megachile rotundata TaxID=143995 RepID=UPI003FD187AE
MDKLMIFIVLCCSVGFLQCNADNLEKKRGYVFTIPYKLPIGVTTTGCISLQNVEPPAYITTELLHQSKVISTASYNLTTGTKACLKLNVPMIKTTDAKIRLTIKFAKYPDDVVYEEKKVEITQHSRFIVVQTDKGMYRPGEEVIIRALQYNQDFTPVNEPIPYMYIKNPTDNTIIEWKKLSTENGMRQMKFYLSSGAKLGKWVILTKMYPNVDHYTLSHFEVRAEGYINYEVKIIPPPYILADAPKLTWKICVRYNYGVPVRGTLVTKLTPYAPDGTNPLEETVKKIELKSPDGCTLETKIIPCAPKTPNPFEEVIKKLEHGSTLVRKLTPYTHNAPNPFEEMVQHLNSPDGCTEIVTSGAVLNLDRWSVLPIEIDLTANFTEYETGITQSDFSRTEILYESIKLKFAPTMPRYFKLDAPYHGKIIVLKPDNTPVPNEIIQLCIETTGNDDYIRHVQECRDFTSSSDGSVEFIIPPQRRNTTSLTIIASAVNYPTKYYFKPDHWKNFMNQPVAQIILYPLYSASNSYVVVIEEKERPTCFKNYTFNVMYTLPDCTEYDSPITFHYSVNSRSGILLDEHITHQPNVDTVLDYSQVDNLLGALKASRKRYCLDPLVHRFQITIQITPDMATRSELLVYYVRPDGEIVSASHVINVDYCYNNNVNAEWNTTIVYTPGENVKYIVQAAPDSLCTISLVESVPDLPGIPYYKIDDNKVFSEVMNNNPISMEGIMLQSGCKDITDNTKKRELAENRVDVLNHGPVHYVYEMQAFNDFGALVMTNMKQSTQSCSQVFTKKLPNNEPPSRDISVKKSIAEISLLKSYFPETWFWDLEPLENMSNISIDHLYVPDKMGTWTAHTACMSPTRGLGIAPIRILQDRRPFFFDYDVPPVTKVGEMIIVNITIHNYLNRKIPVTLKMKMDGFDVYRSQLNISFCVQPLDTLHYQYFIIPRKIGLYNVVAHISIDKENTIFCAGPDIPDSRIEVTKPVKVVGEGFEVERSTTALLCTVNASIDLKYTFNVTYPTEVYVIEETIESSLFVVGNMLGLTPDNLKELVKVPTGCGEQNIAKFVPNIFVITFIDTLKIRHITMRGSAISNLERGYQTELNYRVNDGSYSTFVNSPSSIWLSAFVLKAFALAQKYIYISKTELQQTADWIVKQQLPNGCFPMIGSLVHKDMKGGLENDDSTAPLTVFILNSLLESNLTVPNATIENAMSCIERERAYLNSSLYTKIMTTYTLTLLNHTTAETAVKEMLNISNSGVDTLWWADSKHNSLGSSIEMTSYMILAMSRLCEGKNATDSAKAVRWLLKHKNSAGGFVSTQDTALALQALTTYAVLGGSKSVNLNISVKAGQLERSYKLKNDTAMTPLVVRFPDKPPSVNLLVQGYGCAVAQINVKYNILPQPSQHFDVSVTVRSVVAGKCNILEFTPCARYKGSDGYTNMAILEVSMLTGYMPDRDSLDLLLTSRKIQKYEIENNDLHLYFDKLVKENTCVSFKARKQIDVNNFKPTNVKVYDYYRPELYAMATYTINQECNTTVPTTKDDKFSICVPVKNTTGSVIIIPNTVDDANTTDTNKDEDKPKKEPDCPVCVDNLPLNITDVYCSAKSVGKVYFRSKSEMQTITDMSPSRNVKRSRFITKLKIDPDCTCSVVEKVGYLALVVSKDKDYIPTKPKELTLDKSYIIYALPNIENLPCEVADARVACLKEKRLDCL